MRDAGYLRWGANRQIWGKRKRMMGLLLEEEGDLTVSRTASPKERSDVKKVDDSPPPSPGAAPVPGPPSPRGLFLFSCRLTSPFDSAPAHSFFLSRDLHALSGAVG